MAFSRRGLLWIGTRGLTRSESTYLVTGRCSSWIKARLDNEDSIRLNKRFASEESGEFESPDTHDRGERFDALLWKIRRHSKNVVKLMTDRLQHLVIQTGFVTDIDFTIINPLSYEKVRRFESIQVHAQLE